VAGLRNEIIYDWRKLNLPTLRHTTVFEAGKIFNERQELVVWREQEG
jgi:hypothetical protein